MFQKVIRFFGEKNHSLRYKWTRSFVRILVVPILVNYCFYLFFMNSIKEEVNAKNSVFYASVVQEVDRNIKKYYKISVDFSINAVVRTLSNTESISEVTPEWEIAFTDALNRYYIDLYNTYHTFVYFESADMIGTKEGIETSEEYLKSQLASLEISVAEWKKWLAEGENDTRVIRGPENVNGIAPRYIAIKYNVFVNRNSLPTNMVILLRESALIGIAEQILAPGSFYMDVLNEKGEVISSNLPSEVNCSAVQKKIYGKEGTFSMKLDRVRYQISHVLSEENAWRYIFYISEKVFYNRIKRLNIVFFISVLFIVIAGVILIREIIGKQYSPVAKILSQLPKRESHNQGDEYLQIENMVLESVRSKRESTRIIEKQKKKQMDNMLHMMLNGVIHAPETVAVQFPFDFTKDYNTVVIYDLQRHGELFSNEDLSDFERYGILIDVIENIAGEILENRRLKNYFIESDGNLLCLINHKDITDCELLLEALGEILSYIQKYFDILLGVSVGTPVIGETGLSESYREALYGLEYISYENEGNIVFYEDIKNETEHFHVLGVTEEDLMITYIRAGEKEKACAYIDDLLQRGEQNSIQHSCANEILHSLMRNFSFYIEENSVIINNVYLLLMVRKVEIEKISENLQQLAAIICDKMQEEILRARDANSVGSLVQKIREYVETNYADANLNVERIAEYCGLSTSYVSRVFRAEEQDGISNYIARLRITKAKEIFDRSDARIEDAAKDVGIPSITTFIRLFKKYVGATPGVYKKSKH